MPDRFRARKREDIAEKQLWRSLEETQNEYRRALAEFDAAVSKVPDSLPWPDSRMVVEQAGERQHLAFENYAKALKAFSDYVLDAGKSKSS